jgi:tRNA pseudouridine65 synthase
LNGFHFKWEKYPGQFDENNDSMRINIEFRPKHPSNLISVPPILWLDDHLVAINKPHGLLVHPSPMARNADTSALELLRDHLGRYVYPAHRLDRKTGGVLLMGLHLDAQRALMKDFEARIPQKSYMAVVRGYTPDQGMVDYPLRNESGKAQEAVSHYTTLARTEIALPFGKHTTSRYSLLRVVPLTGRMHQIRRHLAHIFHPIIGDRPHGCNKQNRLFKEKWGMDTMLLHAEKLEIYHPHTTEKLILEAPLQAEFRRALELLDLPTPSP